MAMIKQLNENEYSDDRKKALEEIKKTEKLVDEKNDVNVVIDKKQFKSGISQTMRDLVAKGVTDENILYQQLQQIFTDRDEKYLRSRIKIGLENYRKTGTV